MVQGAAQHLGSHLSGCFSPRRLVLFCGGLMQLAGRLWQRTSPRRRRTSASPPPPVCARPWMKVLSQRSKWNTSCRCWRVSHHYPLECPLRAPESALHRRSSTNPVAAEHFGAAKVAPFKPRPRHLIVTGPPAGGKGKKKKLCAFSHCSERVLCHSHLVDVRRVDV